jgi:hypothetical protein
VSSLGVLAFANVWYKSVTFPDAKDYKKGDMLLDDSLDLRISPLSLIVVLPEAGVYLVCNN